ncbi:hypothetical protein EB796_015513 [Bugula neritina]|uniref:Uncharacterized protein n=1 Tax=Bugula neritina TaxID=10212 RepID=A0A7J7JIT5_BUGNE|nr:hypothetical protein EB796_015513 [Bugula neritina]
MHQPSPVLKSKHHLAAFPSSHQVLKLDAGYCRYLKLSGNKSVNTEGVFSLTIPELIETSTTYQAEIITLPLSNNSHSTFVNFTSYRDVAKRLDIKEGYTNNRPYSVTVSFMRSSYKESINILYNHTSYYVYLYNKDRNSLAVNLDGEQISKQEVNASKTEEFAEVTFDNLLPGTYEFRVWPQKVIYDGTCCESCRTNIDDSQISNFFPVKVKGSEYEPRITPNLEMNKNGNVRLAFLIAPSYYHIKSYSVALVSGQNGNISLVSQSKTPEPKDEWYEAVLWFSKKDVYEFFHSEEEIYAMITPLVSEDVCEESGYCNLNGVCKPCTPSLSNTVTVLEDREPLDKASVLVISLSTSISVALVIAALVVACFVVRRSKARNHSTSSNKLFRHQDSSTSSSQSTDQEELHDSHPDGDTTTIGGYSKDLEMYIAEAPPLKLCIAYTTAPHYAPLYDDLYDILSQILTKFFNCEVINYKNIRPR